MFPQAWREAKVIPLPKNNTLLAQIANQSACYQPLVNLCKMYADDSTLYTSATAATEITALLNKELQLVSESVGDKIWDKSFTKP